LTLDTVERMAKHNGHLFNWYDTRTLEVLAPPYVSTVDSGNLAGHLLATSQACRTLASQLLSAGDGVNTGTDLNRLNLLTPSPTLAPGVASSAEVQHASLLDLAERFERLCMAMDFSSGHC